jgi:hypothetical protein
MTPAQMLFALLVGHALADYPLQGDFLAQAKNRNTSLGRMYWPWALGAHSLINGGAVFLVTGSLVLGLAETAVHAAIDFAKCETWISFDADQALHLACKAVWWVLAVLVVLP